MQKFIKLYKSLDLTEANWRQENIMHEIEVKLLSMHLGGRKMVLYYAIMKLVLQETWVSAFCTFMAGKGKDFEKLCVYVRNYVHKFYITENDIDCCSESGCSEGCILRWVFTVVSAIMFGY